MSRASPNGPSTRRFDPREAHSSTSRSARSPEMEGPSREPSTLRKPRAAAGGSSGRGDVITSTVRPVRRLSALVREDQDGCVCSSGFAVLTPKEGEDGIEADVLLTYLRLPVICEILDLNTTASMYPAIPADRLMRLPIVVPDVRTRKAVVGKVRLAMTARFGASKLLERAKHTVEELIAGSCGGRGG